MKIKIRSWKGVCTWKWRGLPSAGCSICQQSFEATCQHCLVSGEACPPTKAPNCAHWFHLHCAEHWVKDKLTADAKVCPNCRSAWLTPPVKMTASQVEAALREEHAKAQEKRQKEVVMGESGGEDGDEDDNMRSEDPTPMDLAAQGYGPDGERYYTDDGLAGAPMG